MATSVFDDFVLKAKDIADAASKKTGEICEISRYKCECIKLNGEVKKLYEQLGSSVYSMVKNGYDNDELVESLTEEIDEHLARLREINDRIAGMKSITVCPVCGSKNSVENTYCVRCGTKLRKEPEAPKPQEPVTETENRTETDGNLPDVEFEE